MIQATAGERSLFETVADRNLAHVNELLRGKAGPWALQPDQRAFLELMERRVGKDAAMPLVAVQEKLRSKLAPPHLSDEDSRKYRLTDDRIKNIVHELRVNFHVQIGASREAGAGGYYLIATKEEARETTQQIYSQAVTMLRVVIALRGPQTLAELEGQLRLELQPAATKEAHGPAE